METLENSKILVVGLGYVGMPLAVSLASIFKVIGYDKDIKRITELKAGNDYTNELDSPTYLSLLVDQFESNSNGLLLCSELMDVKVNVFIVTVPTPVDEYKSPNLSFLTEACEVIGAIIEKDSIVIFESTVYPGCTEDICIPILESISNLKVNLDFYVGYSPERISPGDKIHDLRSVIKVVSGSNEIATEMVSELYKKIIPAGIFRASSIKVAEASKSIENAQRDVNISFINELALIFDRLGIDTHDVLAAAGTKYNFLPFRPGLVGGHCISVDPYYLAHKSSQLGYHPQVILSGRRVNDSMASFVANKVVKLMILNDIIIKGSKVLILGFTFKENVPDYRNSKIVDIYRELVDYGISVYIYDPYINIDEVVKEYSFNFLKYVNTDDWFDGIILAVAHDKFKAFDFGYYHNCGSIIFDAKGVVDRKFITGRL